MTSTNMKSGKLALVTVLLCGTLFACKPEPEPAAPAAEVPAPAAEPAVAPASEPVVDDPMVDAPMVDDPMTSPAPATDANPEHAAEEDEDTPHSGGDKVTP